MTRKLAFPRYSSLLALSGLGFAALALVPGCSDSDACGSAIESRAMPGVDFSKFETFAIQEIDLSALGGAGGIGGNDPPDEVFLNLKQANFEAAKVLTEGGLIEVDPEKETPDLWIGSAAATEQETGIYWACVPGWSWWGWATYWDPCAWLAPVPVEYTEGTLVLALVDSSTRTPVYGGVAAGVLACNDDVETQIDSAVHAILADYPFDE